MEPPTEDFAAEREPVASAPEGHQLLDPEPAGAVIHEFVRRPQEPDALQWAAEVQAALTQPAELAIPTQPEPEYAEEVEPGLAAGGVSHRGRSGRSRGDGGDHPAALRAARVPSGRWSGCGT